MVFVKDYQKTAIIYEEERVSYADMIKRAKGYAEILEVTPDDKVVIYMENRPEYLYAFLGIWDKKSCVVCLDSSFSAHDLEYYLNDCQPKYIFTSVKNEENVKEAIVKTGVASEILVVDRINRNYQGTELTIQSPDRDQLALMLYTSGTTGDPKGVMLTFDNILVNIEGLETYKMYEKEDIVLSLLPMHHIFPILGSGIVPFAKGSTLVFLKDLSSAAMIEAFQKHKVTMMLGVPRLWEALHKKIMETINASPVTKAVFKLCESAQNKNLSKKIFKKVHDNFGGNVRFFVSGGSKLNPEVSKDFLTLGIDVCEGYGLTETAPMISFTPINQVVPGSAGKIIPGVEVKFTEEGEILTRGRNLMRGYYNKPEATAEVIKDGWFYTGDLGELKGEYLYITGRKKEMIVLSNGKNINPIEIEMYLSSNTDLIQEVAVTEYDQKLTAIIFPNFQKMAEHGVTNITETLKWGVVDKYNREAPNYKKILDVKIVKEELPKTKLGKVRRFMLNTLLDDNKESEINFVEPKFEEYKALREFLEKLKGKKITPKAHLEIDLGLDSLDVTELLAFMHHHFGIEADQSILVENATVEKLARYLELNGNETKIDEINWNTALNSVSKKELKNNSFGKFGTTLLKPLFAFYLKTKVENREKLLNEPAIYVGNHQSFADAFIFTDSVPMNFLEKCHFIAKSKHFNTPLRKSAAENANIIVMDINKNVNETLHEAAAILKSGGNIVIFPEGVRSRDGKMNDFKKSFAILAKELNVPVVPFGIKGAYELFPADQKFPKSGNITIKFFDKLSPAGKSYEEICVEAKEIIEKWLNS